MNEKKKEFVEALSDTLKMDSRSGVESIKYATDIWFEDVRYAEKEIVKEVYDSGRKPVGLLFYGFEEECDD